MTSVNYLIPGINIDSRTYFPRAEYASPTIPNITLVCLLYHYPSTKPQIQKYASSEVCLLFNSRIFFLGEGSPWAEFACSPSLFDFCIPPDLMGLTLLWKLTSWSWISKLPFLKQTPDSLAAQLLSSHVPWLNVSKSDICLSSDPNYVTLELGLYFLEMKFYLPVSQGIKDSPCNFLTSPKVRKSLVLTCLCPLFPGLSCCSGTYTSGSQSACTISPKHNSIFLRLVLSLHKPYGHKFTSFDIFLHSESRCVKLGV